MTDPNKTIIPPTVGRVVWFIPGEEADASDFARDPRGTLEHAALIVSVLSSNLVNLTVFDANGVPHGRTSVPLIQGDTLAPMGEDYCVWMPYQKGQAAKTEAAERRAAAVETKTYADGTVVTGTAPLPEQSPAHSKHGAARSGLFRKKPVVVAAAQWRKNGDHPLDAATEMFDYSDGQRPHVIREGAIVRYFRRPDVDGGTACKHCGGRMHDHGWIDTLEGGHIVCPGDWIITGVQGEHYPCKPDIFSDTYEPA